MLNFPDADSITCGDVLRCLLTVRKLMITDKLTISKETLKTSRDLATYATLHVRLDSLSLIQFI